MALLVFPVFIPAVIRARERELHGMRIPAMVRSTANHACDGAATMLAVMMNARRQMDRRRAYRK